MRKTYIGIMINSFYGFRQPRIEAEYLGAGKPDPKIIALRQAAKDKVLAELESLLQSSVIAQWGAAMDVTRTDRRGRYLPRPV